MVKFLCTREETAERLGVQGISAFGYRRPLEAKIDMNVTCLKCKELPSDSVCGMTLILKSLLFVQQLAHDMVSLRNPRCKESLALLSELYKPL